MDMQKIFARHRALAERKAIKAAPENIPQEQATELYPPDYIQEKARPLVVPEYHEEVKKPLEAPKLTITESAPINVETELLFPEVTPLEKAEEHAAGEDLFRLLERSERRYPRAMTEVE